VVPATPAWRLVRELREAWASRHELSSQGRCCRFQATGRSDLGAMRFAAPPGVVLRTLRKIPNQLMMGFDVANGWPSRKLTACHLFYFHCSFSLLPAKATRKPATIAPNFTAT